MTSSTRRGHHYTNYTGIDNPNNSFAPSNNNSNTYSLNNNIAIMCFIQILGKSKQSES